MVNKSINLTLGLTGPYLTLVGPKKRESLSPSFFYGMKTQVREK